jgi:hypothetical protein
MENSSAVSGASTDQGKSSSINLLIGRLTKIIGNISYELPPLHPGFLIDIEKPDIGPHHPGFEKSAGTRSAFEASLRFAKALAATEFDISTNEELRNQMWADHEEAFGQ